MCGQNVVSEIDSLCQGALDVQVVYRRWLVVSVAFGADILQRRSPKRVSVVELSVAERVANGELFSTVEREM
jgi:hypothetical protein